MTAPYYWKKFTPLKIGRPLKCNGLASGNLFSNGGNRFPIHNRTAYVRPTRRRSCANCATRDLAPQSTSKEHTVLGNPLLKAQHLLFFIIIPFLFLKNLLGCKRVSCTNMIYIAYGGALHIVGNYKQLQSIQSKILLVYRMQSIQKRSWLDAA